ncbi:NTP/NDP exchange transporter [Parapusillimonas granuli]|uniref:MFS transporter n=1 Tax=Parapusillimonas granuli TaxID=380911 RepID=A0A853FUW2_9BURK|nr:MFS transporter [Parapusillimonas granuli]MBB5213701.1 AAA family ATP:ADP antiporter [Parapusillimonas granuli]NYT48538.1 MFS transporter [Parapusillimonas granuli]
MSRDLSQRFLRRIARLFNVEPHEAPAVVAGLSMFFLLFTAYFMLRPVRETMGVAGGVKNLQWLFTGTFIATLIVLPVFGWLASRLPRRTLLPWLYAGCALVLAGFAASFRLDPDNLWVARGFYIWLSVFNLVAISLAWSVLADVLRVPQAKRTFALIAGGASIGGLAGPIAGAVLVGFVGHGGLLLISAMLLLASAAAASGLHRWRDAHPVQADGEDASRSEPLGGNPFEGATETLRSPYLLGITVFVLLLAGINTFLYFEQARLVAEYFPDRAAQTRVFGMIDAVVQALSLIIQAFFTGRVAKRLGVGVLLVSVPAAMVLGFLALAMTPVFAVFVVVMVMRRVGEYALVRPGREMLYTVVPPAQKYKAKNFIDTVVYRGGDAVSGWLKRGIDVISETPTVAMLFAAVLAALWGACGYFLGRRERALEGASASGHGGL